MDDLTAAAPPPNAILATSPSPVVKSPDTAAVEKAVAQFLSGLKNYKSFPPEHPKTVSMLQGVLRVFNQLGEKCGGLIFEVGEQGIVFQGKPICVAPSGDDNPVSVFFRAGISRLGFAPGLEESEVAGFFQIYSRNRVVDEESADDLVSALWRAGFPHILHDDSIELWGEPEAPVDYDAMATLIPDGQDGPEVVPRPGKGWEALRLESDGDNYRKVSLALMSNIPAFCTFTEDERNELAKMVAEDIQTVDSEVAVRLAFMLLARESELPGYEAALGFLQEIYRDFLINRAFQKAFFVLDNVRKEALAAREVKPWALALYQKFYGVILQPEWVDYLLMALPHFSELGGMEIKALGAILKQLPTKVGVQLVVALDGVDDSGAQNLLIEIVAQHARRDREVLAAALSSKVEALVLEMLRIIGELNDRSLVEQFLTSYRYDSRSAVRKESMRILASYNIY